MESQQVGSIEGIKLRIRKFVLSGISWARTIPKDEVGRVFVNQFLRSLTSIGANYEEASQVETNKDLVYKLSVVKKEASETGYWIGLICDTYPLLAKTGVGLKLECGELIRIFASIIRKKKLDIRH